MFLLIAHYSDSIPITEIDKKENNNGANVPQMPEGICPLPKELGYSGIFFISIQWGLVIVTRRGPGGRNAGP